MDSLRKDFYLVVQLQYNSSWGEKMRNYEDYSVEDNVQYINKLLDDGLSMKQIEEDYYNVADRVIVKRLARKGYKRSKEGNRLFVLIDNNKANTKSNKGNSEVVNNTLQIDYNGNVLQNNYNSNVDMEKLLELIDLLEPIKALLKRNELEGDVIDVSIDELKVVKVEAPKVRSFKVDKTTLEKWDRFTKENDLYSVMDLVNSALLEYINKYSRNQYKYFCKGDN